MIPSSELILNADGSIYHLNLLPEDIAHKIILVGDPDRVTSVSAHFDTIRVRKNKREFVTHTGSYRGKDITVLSTGIGTDNIDIVLNELDVLVNVDLNAREIKKEKTSLEIIRIGTSGSIQEDVAVDSFLVSDFGIGMDGLMNFYDYSYQTEEEALMILYSNHMLDYGIHFASPYCFRSADDLRAKFSDFQHGITLTHNGFYAPQGREIRAKRLIPNYIDIVQEFDTKLGRVTNFEMETAGIYGLSSLLGHRALSLNLILANRPLGIFSNQYELKMKELIGTALDRI